jgi:hypothetical protein
MPKNDGGGWHIQPKAPLVQPPERWVPVRRGRAVEIGQLLGSWRLRSVWHEFEAAPLRSPYGPDPTGSLIFTESRVSIIIVPDPDYPSLGNAIEAHSGQFILTSTEISVTFDVTSQVKWRGIAEKRYVDLSHSGDVLFVTSPRRATTLYDGDPFSSAQTWVRENTSARRS